MDTPETRRFWRESPPAARWALAAAVVLAVVAVIPFVVTVVLVSLQEHLSPLTVVFGPMPGMPLIAWLYTTLPPTVIQAAAGLALRRTGAGPRVAGVVAVLVLATIALVWLAAIGLAGVRWLMSGALPGDFYDLLGMVFLGLPVLLTVTGLNLRAAFLGLRDFRGRVPYAHSA